MDILNSLPNVSDGEAIVVTRRPLAALRAELNITQEVLAREAHVAPATISVAERRLRISQFSAYKIVQALNRLRAQAHPSLPPVEFDEIAWT